MMTSLKREKACRNCWIAYYKSASVVLFFGIVADFCSSLLMRVAIPEALLKQSSRQLREAGGIVPWKETIVEFILFKMSTYTCKSPIAFSTTARVLSSFFEAKAFWMLNTANTPVASERGSIVETPSLIYLYSPPRRLERPAIN